MQHNFQLSALYAMDNYDLMQEMDSETVDLIATDPPFNSNRNYQGVGDAAPHKFRDTWSWDDARQDWLDKLEAVHPKMFRSIWKAKDHSGGMAGFLCFMGVRFIEMHRILKPTGSLYLHCDPSANSYLRLLLDDIFGGKQFRNEIPWKRYRGKRAPKNPRKYAAVSDHIYFYSKDDKQMSFSLPFTPLTKQHIDRCYKYDDGDGKGRYMRGGRIKSRKYYLSNSRGTPVTTWWDDIPELNGGAKESTGWKTQKPVALYERIVAASSNPGDIVFDPFCGCGTTLVAAQNLGRRWVGCDEDTQAVSEIQKRIGAMGGQSGALPVPISTLYTPPTRTVTPDRSGQLRDPTGIIVPKRPSDKLTKPAIRAKLMEWQAAMDGTIQCPGCAIILPERHFDLDHLNPVSVGGANHISNRILLCGPCNGDKGNDLTIVGLWKKLGVSRADQKARQETVRRVQQQADAYARTLDAK